MSKPHPFLRLFRHYSTQPSAITRAQRNLLGAQCLRTPTRSSRLTFTQRRSAHGPDGLDPNFVSILDRPAKMARVGKQHGPGLIILAIIPITAFALGCWQVYRLGVKTDLIARFEDRLTFPPLELPLRIDPEAGWVPEISGHRLMVSIRFMRADEEGRLKPVTEDCSFELALCA